eukprot:SAG11_NODE_2306_length_3546_cov_2.802147_2_plen_73_part_00
MTRYRMQPDRMDEAQRVAMAVGTPLKIEVDFASVKAHRKRKKKKAVDSPVFKKKKKKKQKNHEKAEGAKEDL